MVKDQIDFRHFVENKIRQRRFARIVWSAHLNSHSDSLVVLLRQFKNELQIFGHLQASGSRLNFPPSRPDVKLLAQGKSNQILDRLGNIVGLDFLRAHIRCDVGDQALAIVRHDFIRRSCAHHAVVGGDRGIVWVLRERPLIEPISHLGATAEVIASPVVGGDHSWRFADSKFSSYCNGDTALQEISTLHRSYVLLIVDSISAKLPKTPFRGKLSRRLRHCRTIYYLYRLVAFLGIKINNSTIAWL